MKAKSSRLCFEWMIKNTSQTAWIEGKGTLLWLAFFFTEIGAGTYFVSLFIDFRSGWLAGWLTALLLGGSFHILFLGKPKRGWRILNGVARSELSRGLLITLCFFVIGFFQVLPVAFPGLPWEGNILILKLLMGTICVLLISHGFLTMAIVRAIPMWNSPMMVIVSLVSGIWVGSQVVEMILLLLGLDITGAEMWVRWSLICFMGGLALFLWWNGFHSSETAKASMHRILTGDLAANFYILVVTIGIIIPLIITILIWVKDVSSSGSGILFLRFLCVMLGDLITRYCILKGSLYKPLL